MISKRLASSWNPAPSVIVSSIIKVIGIAEVWFSSYEMHAEI